MYLMTDLEGAEHGNQNTWNRYRTVTDFVYHGQYSAKAIIIDGRSRHRRSGDRPLPAWTYAEGAASRDPLDPAAEQISHRDILAMFALWILTISFSKLLSSLGTLIGLFDPTDFRGALTVLTFDLKGAWTPNF